MTSDSKYTAYSRETAMCVDLAYVAMEQDINTELRRVGAQERIVLTRLLKRLHARRQVLETFVTATAPR